MPMTPAERQRKYRERLKELQPEKYEEQRISNLNRIKRNYVKVSKLSDNQKNIRRRYWRKLKKNQKEHSEANNQQKNKTKSRKLYQHHYYKIKKGFKKQKEQIEKQKKVIAALRKKVYRQNILLNCQKSDMNNSDPIAQEVERSPSPSSKAKSPIESFGIKIEHETDVKNVLIENYVLRGVLQKHYASSQNNIVRKLLKRASTSDLVRRYKMNNRLGYIVGLKSKIRFRKRKLNSKRSTNQKKIRKFFLQDDVSRASAGKKETVTFKKKKMQKRYLLDTMTKLYTKFVNDTDINISYTTFTRNKPFYVVRPRISDRDTCVCKIHANIEFKFAALKKWNILDTNYKKLDDFVDDSVCDKRSLECMYSECEICKMIPTSYDFTQLKKDESMTWLEWTAKDVEYKKQDKTTKSKQVLTVTKTAKLDDFILLFETDLKKYKKHVFNITHHYKSYKNLKDHLEENEVLLHCDFSENYNCKMHKEIQSVHFSLQHQISLHTSVVYKKNEKPQGYCTLSDSKNHAPEAIWAHLTPVLIDIKRNNPGITILHIFSDGPSTQYKQKKNFYLFKKLLNDLGFDLGTWNFSESYHGKGAADGVGGSIKRRLDIAVSHGNDILNASTAYNLLKGETSIKLFCVDDTDINLIKNANDPALQTLLPVPNTHKIHQIQVDNSDSYDIYYRMFSCFCNSSGMKGFCDCFLVKKNCLLKSIRPRKRSRHISSSDSVDSFSSSKQQYTKENIEKSKSIFNKSHEQHFSHLKITEPEKSTPSRAVTSKAEQDTLYRKPMRPIQRWNTEKNIFKFNQSKPNSHKPNKAEYEKTECSKSTALDYDHETKIFEVSQHAPGPMAPKLESFKILSHTTTNVPKLVKDTYFTKPANQKHEDQIHKNYPISPKKNVSKDTEKTSGVTILSNIRVNYSPKDLKKMLKSDTKRYNMSSCDFKNDFPDLIGPTPKRMKNFFDTDDSSDEN